MDTLWNLAENRTFAAAGQSTGYQLPLLVDSNRLISLTNNNTSSTCLPPSWRPALPLSGRRHIGAISRDFLPPQSIDGVLFKLEADKDNIGGLVSTICTYKFNSTHLIIVKPEKEIISLFE